MRTKNFIQTAALMLGMTISSVMITSCTAEDNPVNEPQFDEEVLRYVEGIPQTSTDELLLFQNHIVEIDSLGNFVRHIYGMALDPADPNILSIGVEDLAEARAIFEGWLPDEPVITETAPNVLTFYPKDTEGNEQGEIYFTPSNSDDLIAQVTFSESTNLRHFTTIRFIPNAQWPEIPGDANSKYKLWEMVPIDIPDRRGNYQCIRESGNGKKGLLAITMIKANPNKRPGQGYNHGACESIAKEVSGILSVNWDKWAYQKEGEEVWIDKYWKSIAEYRSYTINLKTGKLDFYREQIWYYWLYPNRNVFKQLWVIEF